MVDEKKDVKKIGSETSSKIREYIANGVLVPATKEDYQRWLRGYMEKGKAPTAYSPFGFNDVWGSFSSRLPLHPVFKATRDFKMVPLYGSDAIDIIVPEGVKVEDEDNCGDSRLYLMKDFEVKGKSKDVILYSDTVVKDIYTHFFGLDKKAGKYPKDKIPGKGEGRDIYTHFFGLDKKAGEMKKKKDYK